MNQYIYVLTAIIIGCILRTLVPYLVKIKDGDVTNFDMKFLATLILAIIAGIIAGLLVFPTFVAPVGNLLTIVIAALLWGWGSQSVINNIAGLFIKK